MEAIKDRVSLLHRKVKERLESLGQGAELHFRSPEDRRIFAGG